MKLDERSVKRMVGLHPDLVRVVLRAFSGTKDDSFVVTEGLRTIERQRQLFLERKSKTMRSRHLTGHAVDLAVWEDRDFDRVVDVDEISWKFPKYEALANIIKKAAEEEGVKIEWGGDWETFKDGPHFQLPWKDYP